MPKSAPTQIFKFMEPASFCNFQNRKSCHFVAIGVVYSLRNFWKIKADLGEKKSVHVYKLISGYL